MGRKIIAVFVFIALSVAMACAQGGGPPPKKDDKSKQAPPPSAPRFAPQGREPHGPVFHGPGPHMGDWLRRNENVPPDQLIRNLEQNPDFQRLPPDRQQRLRNRLQNFINLPPEQKDRILQRMETFEHLPPEQQQRLREMFRQFRALPQERRNELNRAFQQLAGMSPEERQRMLDSPEYRNNYTDQERNLLRGMSSIGITPNPNRPR